MKAKHPVLYCSDHRARIVLIITLALVCANAMAQSAQDPHSTSDPLESRPLDEATDSLNEEQVPLDDSFGAKTKRELIREQRKQALADTKADVQIRSYFLDRSNFDGSESTAWALGGYAGFRTGYFRDRFAFGATGYASQRLYGPQDKDGTGLLAPNQQSYAVVGEAYGQYRFTEGVTFDVGRKLFNSPYINKQDSRMTPNAFQLAVLQGVVGGADESAAWRFGAGYIEKIKERNSETFISMAAAAGAPDDIERGVFAGGANYQKGGLSIGAVNYYSDDILNIFYTESRYRIPLSASHTLLLSAQYSAQQSAGSDLLTGYAFSTWQFGVKADFKLGNTLLTTAWNGNGNGADLRSPWGGIPSYNSVQVEDFDRAGENSTMVRAAYEFKQMPGLSAYALWVNGTQPLDPTLSAQDEYDFNLQWSAAHGRFLGFSVRARFALVRQDSGGPDLKEFRLIFDYDPPSL